MPGGLEWPEELVKHAKHARETAKRVKVTLTNKPARKKDDMSGVSVTATQQVQKKTVSVSINMSNMPKLTFRKWTCQENRWHVSRVSHCNTARAKYPLAVGINMPNMPKLLKPVRKPKMPGSPNMSRWLNHSITYVSNDPQQDHTCQKLHLPRKVTLQDHQILRLTEKVTFQDRQILRLPRKMTFQDRPILRLPQKVTLQRHQILHLPLKMMTLIIDVRHMKRHLQCAEQQVSSTNLTKYCACHAE